MELLPEIQRRRSATSFSDKPVDPGILQRILEAGRLAPSAKNRQPWRIVVVCEPNRRGKLAEACFSEPVVQQAPVIIAVCTTNLDYRMPNGHQSWPLDLAFCGDYMAFQATHEGLDTCLWTTYREEEIREILTVPYSMKVPYLLLMGYSAEKNTKTQDRLPLNRILSYDHW